MKKFKKFLKKMGGPIFLCIFVVVFTGVINMLAADVNPVKTPKEIQYWEFEEMVENKQVKEVKYNKDMSEFSFTDVEENPYITGNPKTDNFKKWLYDNRIEVVEIEQNNQLISGIMSILQVIIIYGFFLFMMTRMMPGSKKEKVVAKVPDIKFEDIAGYEETKKNMEFLVGFLKDNTKIKEMGARIPKGVVLYGPPGTGKTLMAKAIAGSAGVPFYSMSGSDFVEMYVGLGASRVRSLFAEARKTAPCIVFIDEIDAVGSKRGQGHSEKDQTINALLAELDGFNGSEGIVTICATNRIEDLDSALIRPGRFDRQIAVPLPDKDDRLKILQIHSKNKKLAEDIDLENLASMTVGFSGATIESLLNEAAIIAVTEKAEFITSEHIDQAFFKILMKGEKKEHKKENRDDIVLVANHEAGHALAIKLLTKDEIPKVTILGSTSGAGGVTFRTPPEKGFMSRKEMMNYIKTLYAGRAAEELYFGNRDDITGGASNDIEVATKMIYNYLTTYGMSSSMGLINVDKFKPSGFSLNDADEKLLEEAINLSKKLYGEVLEVLSKNKKILDEIANRLISDESLIDSQINEIIENIGIEE